MQVNGVSFAIECCIDINITTSFSIGLQASNAGDWSVFDRFKCLKDIVVIYNM